MIEGFDRTTLTREASALLDALLSFVNEVGRTQVPTSTLLGHTGLTQGSLMRARGELARHGLLRTEPGFSASGLRGANVYTLNLCKLDPSFGASLEGESGQKRASHSAPTSRPAMEPLPTPSRGRHARPGWLARLFRRSSPAS